uniref:DUF5641 domain-containing protein n=1 Tax=Amphimedon queenslandica TaxID=400682 RepID=A0A1X7VMC7_AMPQE
MERLILSFRERYTREQKSCSSPRKIKVGDVVIVHSDEQARSFWKLGRVEEIIAGADGNARGGVVRLLSRGKQTTLLKHPVQKLIPLEIEEPPEIEESPDIERTDPTVDTSEKRKMIVKEL